MELALENLNLAVPLHTATPNGRFQESIDHHYMDIACSMEHIFSQFDDAICVVKAIGRIRNAIDEDGITPEMVAMVGGGLGKLGITLDVPFGQPETALEGIIDHIKNFDFKAILMKIIDTIVRIFNKFMDTNKSYTIKLSKHIGGTLSDVAAIDKDAFGNIQATVLPYADYIKVGKVLSSMDYSAALDGTKEDFDRAISEPVKEMLFLSGYQCTKDAPERRPSFSLERNFVVKHGYTVGELKQDAILARVALQHIRVAGDAGVRKWRQEIANLKVQGSTEEIENAVKQMKVKFNNINKLIIVTERISLGYAEQILQILNKITVRK